MYVLITYDVSTVTKEGERRLRQVAKICENVGQRVQNSVFECEVTPSQWVEVKQKLFKTILTEADSLRFYLLGKQGQKRVEHYGAKKSYDISGSLII